MAENVLLYKSYQISDTNLYNAADCQYTYKFHNMSIKCLYRNLIFSKNIKVLDNIKICNYLNACPKYKSRRSIYLNSELL